ncbi:MAG: PQQ-dependent sugar dehydrogenase [Fuerstiella sp.]
MASMNTTQTTSADVPNLTAKTLTGPDGSPLGRRVLRISVLVGVCGAVVAALIFVTGQGAGISPPVLPRPAARVSPDTSKVPRNLPQTGAWRGEDAFPLLTFDEPVRLVHGPGTDRLYVFEKEGRIVCFKNDPAVNHKDVFLDLRDRMLDDNRGPVDLAFHPGFGDADSPGREFVYVFYKRSDGYDVLSRFTVIDGQTADPDSELLLIEQLSTKTHAGGALAFGHDGFLYVSSGEERQTDQKIDRCLHGGVFRIDVDMIGGTISHPPPRQPLDGRTQNYCIPSDNPFVGQPGVLEEFWALGLRNPFTMTVDSETGEIWIGDVGRNTWEEVNRLVKGANYEWSYREGNAPSDRMNRPSPADYVGTATPPYYCYIQSEANNSVIGGYVYRGKAHPQLYGKYVFGDNGSSRIRSLTTDPHAEVQVETLCQLPYYRFEGISGFGLDGDGELYICVLGRSRYNRPGKILRLVPNDSGPSDSRYTQTDQPGHSVASAVTAKTQQSSAAEDRIRPVSLETPAHGSSPKREARLLSETGLFTDLATMQPAAGVIPYTINTPFWSDHSVKKRWIAIPGDGTAGDPTTDRIVVAADFPYDLSFPDDTVFVKHFELPVDEGNPQVIRRLETRVTILKAGGEFCGMTFRWNERQTDAILIEDREEADIVIRTRSGESRTQHWTFPGRADCRMCHNTATGFVLGVNIPQLNCWVTDPEDGEIYSQLGVWNERGMLSGTSQSPSSIPESELSVWPKMTAINDETAPLEERVRSYLAVNCSQCHRKDVPGRPPRPVFDLRFHVPLADRGLVGDQTVVVAGRPSASRLLHRLSTTDHQRMPPVGRETVDEQAVDVIRRWISSLD